MSSATGPAEPARLGAVGGTGDAAAPPMLPPTQPLTLPLTDRPLDAVLMRDRAGRPLTVGRYLSDVAALAQRLPASRCVLNLCRDRYLFLVALGAALARGQTALLTSDRSAARLDALARAHDATHATIDTGDCALPPPGITAVIVGFAPSSDAPAGDTGEPPRPLVPADHVAAIVLTSGTTGEPVANAKPWAALVACSRAAALRFGCDFEPAASLVATVPPEHMYGFETSVLLPLHAAVATYAGPTFFPADVAEALAAVPAPRILVTTPLQIRALLAAGRPLPPIARLISATAPLDDALAAQAEAAWCTEVHEIFGATETGSIASRRTVDGDVWQLYPSVTVRPAGMDDDASDLPEVTAEVAHLRAPVPMADRLELLPEGRFRLLGRRADIVKRAGKRASLAGLNAILAGLDGIEDAAFLAPDDLDASPAARLVAFVVAPGRDAPSILAELKGLIEPAFVPRRIVRLASLPRNAVGKVPKAALHAALEAAGGTGADDGADGRALPPAAR